MKKKLILGIAVFLLLLTGLTACGETPDDTLQTDPTQTTAPAETLPPVKLTLDESVPPAASGSDTAPLSGFSGIGAVLETESGEAVSGTWHFAEDQNGVSSDSVFPEEGVAYTAIFVPDENPEHYAALTAQIIPTVEASAPDFHLPTAADIDALVTGTLCLDDLGLNQGSIYPSGTIQWLDENGQVLDGTSLIEKNKVYTWQYTADGSDGLKEKGWSMSESITLWPTLLPGENTYGNISYKLYVPSGYTPGEKLPLYLYLHGCSAKIESVLVDAGLDTFADENNCLILLPQQSTMNNGSMCWNWFEFSMEESKNLVRMGGEPECLTSIVKEVCASSPVDTDKIFVGGASAGAYMANVLAVTYPDLFSGVMLNSGGAYVSGRASLDAFTQMSSGAEAASGKTLEELAQEAYTQMGEYARVIPMVVVQGTADAMVNQQNGLDAAQCWAEVMHLIDENISTEAEVTTGEANGSAYTLYTYRNQASGQPVIMLYIVEGMGHIYAMEEAGTPDVMDLSFGFFMEQ